MGEVPSVPLPRGPRHRPQPGTDGSARARDHAPALPSVPVWGRCRGQAMVLAQLGHGSAPCPGQGVLEAEVRRVADRHVALWGAGLVATAA